MRLTPVAQAFFAVTMAGLGVIGLIEGHFVPLWSGVPQGLPARQALVYLCALVALLSGPGMLVARTAAAAARLLLAYLVLWFIFFRLPLLARAPADSGIWWACGATSVMIAAALVIFDWNAGERTDWLRFATGDRGLRLAQVLFGLGIIPLGVAHFTFLQHTIDDVPAWMPFRASWAYITGATFIAAGVAIALGVYGRLAARLTTLQVALFTILVWVPIVVGHPSASDWNEFIESWTLTAAAWIVAESFAPSLMKASSRVHPELIQAP